MPFTALHAYQTFVYSVSTGRGLDLACHEEKKWFKHMSDPIQNHQAPAQTPQPRLFQRTRVHSVPLSLNSSQPP